MLFYGMFLKCVTDFNTLSNMKIWNIYSQIVTEPFQKYL